MRERLAAMEAESNKLKEFQVPPRAFVCCPGWQAHHVTQLCLPV